MGSAGACRSASTVAFSNGALALLPACVPPPAPPTPAGQKSIRPYWRNYYDNTDVLIYVVDSADTTRLEEVNKELSELLAEEKLAGVPLLVFANKQDLMGALSAADISTGLNLEAISGRSWSIQACSAKRGDGLEAGMGWAVERVRAKDASA